TNLEQCPIASSGWAHGGQDVLVKFRPGCHCENERLARLSQPRHGWPAASYGPPDLKARSSRPTRATAVATLKMATCRNTLRGEHEAPSRRWLESAVTRHTIGQQLHRYQSI